METPAGMMKECIREGRPDNVGLTKRRVKLFEYNEKWNHARRLFVRCLFVFKENDMIRLYNSKTLKVEDFKPIHEGHVDMYVCGPTVYNYAHIGNARPMIVFDVLKRLFEAEGYTVTYVSNRAVYRENGKSYVHMRDESGNVISVEVVTGFSDGSYVEIIEGLSEGDTVLIESGVSDS